MVSFHCASSTATALALRAALRARGLRVWCCTEDLRVGAAYRTEIARNAALCGVLVPLVGRGWAASPECEFEFNIALRTALVTKSSGTERPRILPLVMPDAAPLFGDMLALAERFPCLVGIASNTNARFLAPAACAGGGTDAVGSAGDVGDADFTKDFDLVAAEVAALLGVSDGGGTGTGAEAGAEDARMQEGNEGALAAANGDAGVPFDPKRHFVLRSSTVLPNYEGYFTDWRKIDGKEVGSRWAWSTALIIAADGALSGAGRDESSSSEIAGRIDEATGRFAFVKTCFGPAGPSRSWRIYYRGETFDNGDGLVAFRGRWSHSDVRFPQMSALCTMSLWARLR
jgi:hypothetical protein